MTIPSDRVEFCKLDTNTSNSAFQPNSKSHDRLASKQYANFLGCGWESNRSGVLRIPVHRGMWPSPADQQFSPQGCSEQVHLSDGASRYYISWEIFHTALHGHKPFETCGHRVDFQTVWATHQLHNASIAATRRHLAASSSFSASFRACLSMFSSGVSDCTPEYHHCAECEQSSPHPVLLCKSLVADHPKHGLWNIRLKSYKRSRLGGST